MPWLLAVIGEIKSKLCFSHFWLWLAIYRERERVGLYSQEVDDNRAGDLQFSGKGNQHVSQLLLAVCSVVARFSSGLTNLEMFTHLSTLYSFYSFVVDDRPSFYTIVPNSMHHCYLTLHTTRQWSGNETNSSVVWEWDQPIDGLGMRPIRRWSGNETNYDCRIKLYCFERLIAEKLSRLSGVIFYYGCLTAEMRAMPDKRGGFKENRFWK